jgi:hypothetical protein
MASSVNLHIFLFPFCTRAHDRDVRYITRGSRNLRWRMEFFVSVKAIVPFMVVVMKTVCLFSCFLFLGQVGAWRDKNSLWVSVFHSDHAS